MQLKLPMITLYHNPKSAVSREALRLLKHAALTQRFRIDLSQSITVPPTGDQVDALCKYLGRGDPDRGARVILVPEAPFAKTSERAFEILSENPAYLKKPLVVDWLKGRAVVADVSFCVQERGGGG